MGLEAWGDIVRRSMSAARTNGPRDEGPSPEDLRRFGGETAFCPDCGARVWDQADVCPSCYAYLGGETARRRKATSLMRWKKAILASVLIAMLLSLAGFSGLLRVLF